MKLSNILTLITFCLIVRNSAALTAAEEKCLIATTQNLNIKHVVIITEETDLNLNNIRLMKNMWQYNIFTQYYSIHRLHWSISYQSNIFKRKTLYLLDTYSFSENLFMVFNEDYEVFVSDNIWVTFNKNQHFKYLYIPYNCQFIVIESDNEQNLNLREFYNTRLFSRDVFVTNFAKWNEKNNLQISGPDFYQRRFDTNQTLLTIVRDYSPPACFEPGLCVYKEMVIEITRMMNFRPRFVSPDDLPRLFQNGIIYEVVIGFAVVDSIDYRKNRMGPIWKTPAFLHIKYVQLYEEGERSPYLRPFDSNLWLILCLWLLLSGFCIAYIDSKILKRNYSIIDSIFRPLESFTNQCGGMEPTALSSRIAVIILRIAPVFLVSLYGSVILSFVTVKVLKLPFTDLQGLIKDGSFKFGFQSDTLIGVIINESNSQEYRAVREKFLMDLNELPKDTKEGVDKICENSKLALAFFNNDIFSVEQKCKIIQIPKSIYQTWDALPLRRSSSYYTIFNRILKTFRSSGVSKRMEKTVTGKKPEDEEPHYFDPVEFQGVAELLMMICALYLIVPVILIIELLMYKK